MKKILIVAILAILLIVYRFCISDPLVSGKTMIFGYWAILCIAFKINGKYSVMVGLLLLLGTGLILLFGHQGLGLRVSVYSYGFLLMGTIIQFISLLREKSNP